MPSVKFKDLKPGLQPTDEVRVRISSRRNLDNSYFSIVYVNKEAKEVVIDGGWLFVKTAEQFDNCGYLWSDET